MLGLLMFATLGVYTLRLIDWQLVNGAAYLQKADRTSVSTVAMDAARGEILDINGQPLAVNRTGYAVVFTLPYMTNDNATRNATIHKLIGLLDRKGQVWEDPLPIRIAPSGAYEFVPDMEKEVETLKGKDFLDLNSYASAAECMQHLLERYDIEGYSATEARDVASVRYGMTKEGFSVSLPYTFAKDVSPEIVGIVKENSQLLPGATIKITTMREYPAGDLMPHIIGTMGPISAEEYDRLADEGYAFNDRLGKSGIEQAFERELRGKIGEKVVETTNRGLLASETVTKAPVPGQTIYLTLDSRVQKVAQVSLANNVNGAREYGQSVSRTRGTKNNGEDCVAGGVVAMRVKDFSVIAAATFPSYDLTRYANDSSYYSTLVQDESRPLVNRAFNGIFTPGSCVKPAVASAALQEGVITNTTSFYCGHVYERFQDVGFAPTCLGYHGNITLRRGIAESCNIYFFETGYRLGIDNMNQYFKKFGLGVKTGVELSESVGTLAGRAYSASVGKKWVLGDTVQAAIGQSDNQFTPLQLCTYVATVANNGARGRSHVVSKITDYTRKELVMENDPNAPEIVETAGVSPQNFDYVKQGMRAVITDRRGSGHPWLGNYGIALAGKTGTAETPASDNVAFVGFAPYENPEIAVAVVLEHGSNGRYSMQVARDVLDAYFYGKYVDESGNLVLPGPQAEAASSSPSARAGAE